jgi:predicted nucleic acid-binding Zn ribbon protein
MVVYANGGTKMETPTVFYSKKACVNAQEVIQEMTPRNATATFITSCVSRGGRGNGK